MNRKNIKPVLVLSVICVVVALLLALVNMLTSAVIEKAEQEAISASLQEVMPGGEFEKIDAVKESETVSAVYKETSGKGYVVTVEVQGFASEIAITVAVDNDGKVIKALITKEQETHNQPGIDEFVNGFSGLGYEGFDNDELKVSQATGTSKAIKKGVKAALFALGFGEESEESEETLPKTDDEIKALAKELIPEASEFVALDTEGAASTVKRLYKDKGGKGYVAYVVTSTEWVPVESEGIIAFDANGKITDLRLLTWTVGGEGKDNPTDAFVQSFLGKTPEELDGVEFITEVTRSSVNFRDAVRSAGELIVPPSVPWARIVGISALVLAVAVTAATVVIKGRKRV